MPLSAQDAEDLTKAIQDITTLSERYNLLQADFSAHLHDHALMMAVPTDAQRALLENVEYLARQLANLGNRINKIEQQPPAPL